MNEKTTHTHKQKKEVAIVILYTKDSRGMICCANVVERKERNRVPCIWSGVCKECVEGERKKSRGNGNNEWCMTLSYTHMLEGLAG
jgi:hypothetical protein